MLVGALQDSGPVDKCWTDVQIKLEPMWNSDLVDFCPCQWKYGVIARRKDMWWSQFWLLEIACYWGTLAGNGYSLVICSRTRNGQNMVSRIEVWHRESDSPTSSASVAATSVGILMNVFWAFWVPSCMVMINLGGIDKKWKMLLTKPSRSTTRLKLPLWPQGKLMENILFWREQEIIAMLANCVLYMLGSIKVYAIYWVQSKTVVNVVSGFCAQAFLLNSMWIYLEIWKIRILCRLTSLTSSSQ